MILLTIKREPTSSKPLLLGRSRLSLFPQQPLMADPKLPLAPRAMLDIATKNGRHSLE